jgi:predicted alpha/beta hydrolase
MPYIVLIPAVLLLLYVVASYYLYRRAFVPTKPRPLDDFTFTPFEFQADYEEVELVTADGINFGAWHFRQPGSPQTVIVSGGHKGQRQGSLGISAGLWRKGFNVILYSYRGWPGSDPAPITFGIKEVLELEAVIAFARKRIPHARIGLLGFSILLTVLWIAVQAFAATQIGLRLGNRIGEQFRERSEWVAGAALIVVALILLVLKLARV